jgi:hypothetical protein
VENALKGVNIDNLAILLYKNWFEGRLTVTCPEPDDTIEFAGGHGPTKKDMERLNTLEGLNYSVTCVNGRVRLKFHKGSLYRPLITSPFSLQTAKELFKDKGDVTPDQVETLSDFIFRVFTRILVEVKPKIDVNHDRVTVRFSIESIEMTNQVFRELFLATDCTNDISTFFILAKKDTLELVVEFLFQ